MDSIRTCLVCRNKASKPELCRFVRALDGEICFDEKGEVESRGAWLCAKRSCLSKAFQKRMLFRGERTLPIDSETMISAVSMRIKKRVLSRFGLLKRLGHIEVGREPVMRIMSASHVACVVMAKDLSVRSVDEFQRKFTDQKFSKTFASSLGMEEIGACLGRRKTGVVALLESRITDEILLQLHKLKELEK